MADVNGVAADDDRTELEVAGGDDHGLRGSEAKSAAGDRTVLMQKVAALERENGALAEREKRLKEQIVMLESERMEMKAKIEQSDTDRKAVEAIAPRASQLEAEVSRLQHDLITSMSESQEANQELLEAKKTVDELRKENSEKISKLEVIEKDRNLLLERIEKENELTNETHGLIRELEEKIEALEVRMSDLKSEKIKIETEMKVKINEKENEVRSLKKMAEELEYVANINRADLEKLKKEKQVLELVNNELEALLKKSETKEKENEEKVDELQRELEASDKEVNGNVVVSARDLNGGNKKWLFDLGHQWPVLAAASAGTATLAVIVCFLHSRRR